MQSEATQGVDGGLAEDDRLRARDADGEVAEVLVGPRRHASPWLIRRASEFRSDRSATGVFTHHEDSVAFAIGVDHSGVDQGVDHGEI